MQSAMVKYEHNFIYFTKYIYMLKYAKFISKFFYLELVCFQDDFCRFYEIIKNNS